MAYRKEQHFFPGTVSGTSIAYFLYTPQDMPARGILQLCHGMCEYIERYEDLAAYLTGRGWVVAGHDQMGHGQSAPTPDQWGYFGNQNGWKALVEDLHQMTVLLHTRFPGLPLILLGHSMGSFVAREYLACYGREVDGAILSGTAGPNPMAPAGIALARMIAWTKGAHYRSALLHDMAFKGYNDRFGRRTPYEWLTRDTEIVNRYQRDPRCTFTFTAAGFSDLFTLLRRVSAPQWAGRLPRELPVLLVAGALDPVGQYGKGPRLVLARLRRAGMAHVTLRLYPEDRHEVLNELDKAAVYQDILSFISPFVCQ